MRNCHQIPIAQEVVLRESHSGFGTLSRKNSVLTEAMDCKNAKTDKAMDRRNASRDRCLLHTVSFLLVVIIIILIAPTGPNKFGKKASYFIVVSIFLIPVCAKLLTVKFVKRRKVLAGFRAFFIHVYYPLVLLCFLAWSIMVVDLRRSLVLTTWLGLVMLCQGLAVFGVVDEVKPEGDDEGPCTVPAEVA